MEKSGGYLRQKVVGSAELLLRLARKADDDINPDKGIGHGSSNGRDALLELRLRVATPHQGKKFIRSALDRDMEVRLEFGRRSAKGDDFVGQEVWLDRRDAVAFDAFNAIQRPQQIEERLARRTAKVTRIDARDDNLLLPSGGNRLGFADQVGNRHVAAAATRIVNRAVGAFVVATVLHLQIGACSIP